MTRGVEGIIRSLFPELWSVLDEIDLQARLHGVDWSMIPAAREEAREEAAHLLLGELSAAIDDASDEDRVRWVGVLAMTERHRMGGGKGWA